MFKASSNALALLFFVVPVAALADVTGTPTLAANTTLSLDTGQTVTSGGDILWTGSGITPQGSATAIDVTTFGLGNGSTLYSSVTSQLITSFVPEFGNSLSGNALSPAANDVLIIKTNGGNYAKVLVTAISGTSMTIEFDTFVTAAAGPNIASIQNNYSNILAGLPNYGIAPGSLFVIYGTGLASSTNTAEAFPLALNLNGTSVSVTVNGTTVQPGLYYVVPGSAGVPSSVAAVLPSTTPAGQGTLTVTNGSQTSAAFPIQVVQSAFGIDTVYGTGGGQATVTDANYKLIGFNASASPGQTVIIWGSGVGADTKNDDRTYPAPNLDNLNGIIPMQAYVGGLSASIVYAGRSQFPGVDQVIVTIPQNVPAGCNDSIVLLSGSPAVASNFATIAVNPGGGACSDANSPFNITSLTGDSTVSFGSVGIFQSVESSSNGTAVRSSTRVLNGWPFAARLHPRAVTTTTMDSAIGTFQRIQGVELGNYASYNNASIGSCIVYDESTSGIATTPFTETGLDAGNITVSGPSGSATLMETAELAGFYDVSLSSSFIPTQGGSFTFNGGGGKDVGSFSATVTLGTPLFTWTNMASTTSVSRAKGVTVTWQGGQPGTYVEISGFSEGNTVGAGFVCLAQQGDLQFTVPSWVTSSLPAGTGDLDVLNVSNPVKFTATGLNFAYAYALVDAGTQVPFN